MLKPKKIGKAKKDGIEKVKVYAKAQGYEKDSYGNYIKIDNNTKLRIKLNSNKVRFERYNFDRWTLSKSYLYSEFNL